MLEQPRFLDAARDAAAFVLRDLRDAEGSLLRTYKDGQAKLNAYLEDHAFLLDALLTLYQATFEPRWFTEARALADTMIDRFADPERGGFFETSSDHERLVARRKDLEDHPIPSGNSAAALGLLRLAALTGEYSYEERAAGRAGAAAPAGRQAPARVRQPAAGGRLPPGAGARGRAGRRRHRPSWRGSCDRELRPHLVLAGGDPGGRAAAGRAANRWTAAPRPTCASASPASGRSRQPAELDALLASP